MTARHQSEAGGSGQAPLLPRPERRPAENHRGNNHLRGQRQQAGPRAGKQQRGERQHHRRDTPYRTFQG